MIPGMDNDEGVGEVEVELHRRTRMRVLRHIHYMHLIQSCTAVQITAHLILQKFPNWEGTL